MGCFAYFAGQEHFIDDGVHLVEIEHQIQFAHIVEVFVEHLNEIVDAFQIAQVVIVYIDAYAKIQSRVSSIDDFEVAKLFEKREEPYPRAQKD